MRILKNLSAAIAKRLPNIIVISLDITIFASLITDDLGKICQIQ